MLFSFQTYSIGDYIEVSGGQFSGTISSFHLQYIALDGVNKKNEKAIVVVPNSMMWTTVVTIKQCPPIPREDIKSDITAWLDIET